MAPKDKVLLVAAIAFLLLVAGMLTLLFWDGRRRR